MPTYYIAPTGNDTTGAGTSGNPWKTLNKFLSVYANGDTLILLAGTYNVASSELLSANALLDVGKSATIKAATYGNVIINGGTTVRNISTNDGAHSMSLENLIFRNFDYSGTTKTPLIHIRTATNLTNCLFQDITIKDDNQNGGLFGYENWNTTATGGITTVSGCIFDTIISPSGSYGVFHSSGRLAVFDIKNSTFYNSNVIWKGLSNEVITRTVKNCIFQSTVSRAIQATVGGTPVFNNNHTFNYTSVPTGTGNIVGDPKMIDPANDNFGLQSVSLARAAGDPSA